MTLFDLLHENALADNDVLRLSDRQGDVFNRPRDVDFLFKTQTVNAPRILLSTSTERTLAPLRPA